MSNSSLVSYTKISPCRTSPRNHVIDTITIHCVVGQLSVEAIGECFASISAQASCNYGIGADGRVMLCVEEKDRSWCSSNKANDNRAVTIECACDPKDPYAINDKVYATLIKLCADICQRNGIPKLLWKADKSLVGQVDKQNMTVHRWFANKACPGDYIYNRLGKIADEVNALLGKQDAESSGTQAKEFKGLSEAQAVEKIGPLCAADQQTTGVLASLTAAQFILESGYGTTDLAQNANNCFGMKASLSGNTWESAWNGDVYTKNTKEYENGQYITIKADFRKYFCVEDSIADHSAYLLGAMNGSKKRYEGLKGCTEYRKAAQIVKNGGYATDPLYVDKLCNIIKKWNLTKYESGFADNSKEEVLPWYRVRKNWEDATSQLGAYHDIEVAKKFVDEHPGYGLFDENGTLVYQSEEVKKKPETGGVPFLVKIDIDNLNIRTGPGTEYSRVQFIPVGIYTIVEVKTGNGAKYGWGKLKSGLGWISLDFATRTV